MALTKLTIPPDQSSYAVQDGNEALSAKLDGGASRFRRDIIGAASLVNVQWSVGPDKFTYLRAFYKTISATCSLPFLIDLFLDESELTEHTVHFVVGSMKLTGQRGLEFTVVAQLEVIPDIPDDEYNQTIVDLFNEYGSFEAAQAVLDQLEILCNIDLPNYMGPVEPTLKITFGGAVGLDPVITGGTNIVWTGPSAQVSTGGTPTPALAEAGEWVVTMDDFGDVTSIVADSDSVVSIVFNDSMDSIVTLTLDDNPNLIVDLIVNEIYDLKAIVPAMTVDISGTCPIVSAASAAKIATLEAGPYLHSWTFTAPLTFPFTLPVTLT